MFLHQLIHVLLILLHTRLQVIFLSLQTADLFLQLYHADRKDIYTFSEKKQKQHLFMSF